jgi:signal transduction histidine kinase
MQETVPQMVGVFAATIGLYMLLIWAQRRRDTMYAYFALAAIVIAISAYPWISWEVVDVPRELINAMVRFKTVFLFMCFLRLAGWHWPRTERAMWLLATLVASLDIASYLDRSNALLLHGTFYATLLTNGATTALALWIGWRLRTPESLMLALAQSLSYGLLFLANLPLAFVWEDSPNLGFFHLVPIYLAMGWILTRRFARSLNDAERLNADLEQRVAQKHAELQRNYVQLEQMSRQAAVAEERHRIMSDMHDGIGGQLISTLNLVEHGSGSTEDVAVALRECLDDLRLIIDSLQPSDDDLLPVLGNLRYRLEGRLRQQGITLDWQVGEVPKLSCLTPQNVLQVLRILQEAFTNILKHAHASQISVGTSIEAGRVSIRVSDNGRGFGDSQGTGHGLASMHDRARRIGGVLQVAPSPGGTTLALSLPIG